MSTGFPFSSARVRSLPWQPKTKTHFWELKKLDFIIRFCGHELLRIPHLIVKKSLSKNVDLVAVNDLWRTPKIDFALYPRETLFCRMTTHTQNSMHITGRSFSNSDSFIDFIAYIMVNHSEGSCKILIEILNLDNKIRVIYY